MKHGWTSRNKAVRGMPRGVAAHKLFAVCARTVSVQECCTAKARAWYAKKVATDPTFRERQNKKAVEHSRLNPNVARKKKDCNLRRKYGISIEEYEAIHKSQNDLCKICGLPETRGQGAIKGALSVDHDHTTGKVRGLLCKGCNIALGEFKHDPVLMLKAVEYLNLPNGG